MTATGDDPVRASAVAPAAAASSRGRTAAAVGEVCPYLRDLSGAWRGAYASRDHRCAAVEPPAPLAAAKQRALCLVDSHRACSTYLAAREQAAVAEPQGPPGADLWPETRAVPLLLEPARGVMAIPGGSVRAGGQAILAGLMVLAVLLLVVSRTTAPPASGSPEPDASASGALAVPSPSGATPTSPTPGASAKPGAASPSSGPSALPSATAAVPSPSAAPTARPEPTAAARQYTVQSGDTLSGIAAQFGTTVKAIRAANDLSGNVIRPGQVLVIP